MNITMGGLSSGSSRTVFFIRHGKSEAHIGKVAASSRQILLTPDGEEKAEKIAYELPYEPDLIISSPYFRAWKTAVPTMRRFPNVPRKVWLDVQEFTYLGPITGVPSSMEDRYPLVEEYWEKSDPDWHFGHKESESFTQFLQRTEAILARLEKHKGFIFIFTHEQFIRAAQGILEGWLKPTPEKMRQFRRLLKTQPLPFGDIRVMRDRSMQDLQTFLHKEEMQKMMRLRKMMAGSEINEETIQKKIWLREVVSGSGWNRQVLGAAY